MADQPPRKYLVDPARAWQWGLFWIVLGFCELLDSIYHQSTIVAIAAVLVIFFILPGTDRSASWKRWFTELAINFSAYILLGALFWWLSVITPFDRYLAISSASLLAGILFQLWAQFATRRARPVPAPPQSAS